MRPGICPKHPARNGFSLLELAIVIALVGVITGGILVAKDLSRSVEIKNFIKEDHKYKAAAIQFRERFAALPGDMPTATGQWGVDADCAFTGKATCDGNGNSQIDGNEPLWAWHHMANAELIEGFYTGSNRPETPIIGSYWHMEWIGNDSANNDLFNGYYAHILRTVTVDASTFTFTAPEMQQIDAKWDDGMPAMGDIVSQISAVTIYCADRNDASATDDDLDSTYLTHDKSGCLYIHRNFLPR